jgi:hypothetical protein
MSDTCAYDLNTVHPVLLRDLIANKETRRFHPPLYLNEFWHTKERRVVIDAEAGHKNRLPLRLSFSPISLYKLQVSLTKLMACQVAWMG